MAGRRHNKRAPARFLRAAAALMAFCLIWTGSQWDMASAAAAVSAKDGVNSSGGVRQTAQNQTGEAEDTSGEVPSSEDTSGTDTSETGISSETAGTIQAEDPADAQASVPDTSGPYLDYAEICIPKGRTFELKVKNCTGKVKWSCGNGRIASVRKQGSGLRARVRAKKVGYTWVTAKTGKTKLRCKVYISQIRSAALSANSQTQASGTWTGGTLVDGSGNILFSLQKALSRKLTGRKSGLAKYQYLYVGASRARDMKNSVSDSRTLFYPCAGAGFSWFFKKYNGKAPAILKIRRYLKAVPDGTVLFDIGGNDQQNIDAYIGFYRDLIKTYPSARFFFIDLLPREADRAGGSQERKEFNLRMHEAFPGRCIILYDYVDSLPKYKTRDGTHYYRDQTRLIYQRILEQLGRRATVNQSNGVVSGN